MSRTMVFGGRCRCTLSIHWPGRSTRAARVSGRLSHFVSKRPIWLAEQHATLAGIPVSRPARSDGRREAQRSRGTAHVTPPDGIDAEPPIDPVGAFMSPGLPRAGFKHSHGGPAKAEQERRCGVEAESESQHAGEPDMHG